MSVTQVFVFVFVSRLFGIFAKVGVWIFDSSEAFLFQLVLCDFVVDNPTMFWSFDFTLFSSSLLV